MSTHAATKKVLIVDDDATVRSIVATTLKRSSFEVCHASSGGECLHRMRNGFHGVILMDVMMPGLTGWQTIRMLAEENLLQGSAVCMLTGLPVPDVEAEGLEELVLDYLAKPFDATSLLRMTEEAMAILCA